MRLRERAAIAEDGSIAAIEIRFGRQSFGEQAVVRIEFDVLMLDLPFHLGRRRAVDQRHGRHDDAFEGDFVP
jgi:hypothetical protein